MKKQFRLSYLPSFAIEARKRRDRRDKCVEEFRSRIVRPSTPGKRSAAMSPVHLMVMSRRVRCKVVMTVGCFAR